MKRFGWKVVGCSMPAMQAAATGKARSPRVDRCTDGTTSVKVVDERRWRRPSTSVVRRTLSARYGGADPLRHRNARTQRRNWIRSGTKTEPRDWRETTIQRPTSRPTCVCGESGGGGGCAAAEINRSTWVTSKCT